MPTYKTENIKTTCITCGEKTYRTVSGISASERREKAEGSQCKVCYAKSQPKQQPIVSIAVRQAERELEIRIFNSYDIKDTLKERNYKFESLETLELYSKTTNFWYKRIPTGNNTEELLANFKEEKEFILSQGYKLDSDRITQKIFSA